MNTLTQAQLIELGGKLWEKGSITRVYLNISAINELRNQLGYGELESVSKKMKQAKTFFDVNTCELKSDVGMIRSSLNSIGLCCSK